MLLLSLAGCGLWLAFFTCGAEPAIGVQTRHDVVVVSSEAIGNGRMTVLRKGEQKSEISKVLIHFHGAVDTITREYLATDFDGIVVVVNFPGLSSVYATPFENDPDLFATILRKAIQANSPDSEGRIVDGTLEDMNCWVSSFSAGFGAVRKILESPENVKLIDSIIMADSIYAGVENHQDRRTVSAENMRGFLMFAQQASAGEKTMLISHSAQVTDYASTTETADYLLSHLHVPRHTNSFSVTQEWVAVSTAQQQRFAVLGFAGESGPDHMEHLRRISGLWDLATNLQVDAQLLPQEKPE